MGERRIYGNKGGRWVQSMTIFLIRMDIIDWNLQIQLYMEPIDINKDLQKIIKEGFLEKQSRFIKSWRKRWFVLTPETLYTFKECKKYNSPTEALPLKSITSITPCDDETHKENSFKINAGDRVFYMAAETNGEKELWIGQIGKSLVKLNLVKPNFDFEKQDGAR